MHQTHRLIFLLCICSFSLQLLAQQQPLSKSERYELGLQIVKNKLKVPLQQLPKWMPSNETSETENTTLELTFRDTLANDIPVSASAESESEIFAAINPIDSNHMIVSGMRLGTAGLSFSIYTTFDGGDTWTQSSIDQANALIGGGDPIILFDIAGKATFVWIALTFSDDFTNFLVKIHTASSLDGGLSWEVDEALIDESVFSFIDIDRFVDKEWLSIDNNESSPFWGNQYVAYTEIMFSDSTYHILVKTREPDSTQFSTPAINVSGEDFAFIQFPSIDVDREGIVHLSFVGQLESDGIDALFYTQSIDGGQSFSEPTVVHPISLACFPRLDPNIMCNGEGVGGVDDMRLYPCPHLRVDKSGGENDGNIYLTWTAHGLDSIEMAGTEVFFSKSENGGNDWTSATKISDEENNDLDDFYSMLEVNENGVVNICWYDRAEVDQALLTTYQSRMSMDGGESFEAAQTITSEASDFSFIGNQNNGFGIGEYNETVSTADFFIPFWADGRNNDGDVDIYMAKLRLQQDSIDVGWEEISTISSLFSVRGPQPNPTKDALQLQVELQQKSDLNIALYDLKGGLVREFVSSNTYTLGIYDFNWSVADLSVGTYILKVETDFGFKSKRLVLVK